MQQATVDGYPKYRIEVGLNNPDTVQELKVLLMEYFQSIPYDVEFQDVSKEIEQLPAQYVPDKGGLFVLAWNPAQNNQLVGCVAYRRLSNQVCEMKRLYVKPWHRGLRLGETLVNTLLGKAKENGYKKMKLDTIQEFKPAVMLYEKMGFGRIQNYNECPLKTAMFYEKVL